MKVGIFAILFVGLVAVAIEAAPGRVKCSVSCWERLPACKERCRSIRMATRACHAQCQDKVATCIRDECGVSENVDTEEEHRRADYYN